jgi:outer membrane lipoprotein-sorting protein
MKSINRQSFIFSGTAIVVVGLFIVAVSADAGTTAMRAADILKRSDDVSLADTSKIYITQTVIAPSGDKRTFKMVSYTKNGNEKGLTEYLAPTQVKGMKILTLNDGDDIWSYFPSTNRVRKIASSARNRKVQGSDFSYDDMASGKMAESWRGTVSGEEKIEGVLCYRLMLTPTEKGPRSYSKTIAWVSRTDFTTRRVVYFDKYGEKSKQLDIRDYRTVSGVQVPYEYLMTSLLDGGKTTMKVAHAEVNIPLADSLFTEAGLTK